MGLLGVSLRQLFGISSQLEVFEFFRAYHTLEQSEAPIFDDPSHDQVEDE
jgi:hypothetical protein